MSSRMILVEGGLASHMSHLFEDPSLTFRQIKDVLQKAASGKLIGTEKTDGQNLFISYSIRDGEAKAARNKGNIKQGGLNAQGLAAKFSDHPNPNLVESFSDAFSAFERVVGAFGIEDQIKIFGPDANIFYNAEIQDPRTSNIINYDSQTLTIHRVGHAEYDKETGQVVDKDLTGNFEALSKALEGVQDITNDREYRVQTNAIRNLQNLQDKNVLNASLIRIEKIINEVGVSDNQSIAQYLISRLSVIIDQELQISDEVKKLLLKRLLGVEGITLTHVLKITPPEKKEIVRSFVKDAERYLKEAIYPLEDIIHDFSVEILKSFDSAFVLDSSKEIERLKQELNKAVKVIEQSGNEEAMSILQRHMGKIKDIENISTAVEGFVFDYNGRTYKLTGNFAPMNQILGLFKYGRGKVPPLQQLNDVEGMTDIALYPGKFKPPHNGHFMVVKRALKITDKVYVFISPKVHQGFTGEQSKKIWDVYIASEGLESQIVPIISNKSPVSAVYDYIDDVAKPGDSIALLLGEKDIKDRRFSSTATRRQDVTISQYPVPPQADGISSSDMRSFIQNNEKEKFFKSIPSLESDMAELVWNIANSNTGLLPEYEEILNIIGEMSSASGGGVSGYSGKIEDNNNNMLIREDELEELFNIEENFMDTKRETFLEEMKLRKFVKRVIAISEARRNVKKKKDISEERKLRSFVKQLLRESQEDHPHSSTGINVLSDLLKKVVPVFEIDFKSLTTDPIQRQSFRAHIIKAVMNSLAPSKGETDVEVDMEPVSDPDLTIKEQEDVNIDTSAPNKPKDPRFIDIDGDGVPDSEETPEDQFGIDGEDETGRNIAMQSFAKVEKGIIDAYGVLSNEKDRTLFYEFLITNLKLYFDKFEDELETSVKEPSTDQYEKDKSDPGINSDQDLSF